VRALLPVAAVLLSGVLLPAGELPGLVVLKDSVSPDGKFAVAVHEQKEGEYIDEVTDEVVLVDQVAGKRCAVFPEAYSSGGYYGTPTENVKATWSPDSKLVILNMRAGRLMHHGVPYRIKDRKAVMLKMPDSKMHPKGKIMDLLKNTANPSARLRFGKEGTLIRELYGFYLPEDLQREDLKKIGFGEDGDVLYFIYRFEKDGNLKIEDITYENPEQEEDSLTPSP